MMQYNYLLIFFPFQYIVPATYLHLSDETGVWDVQIHILQS